MKTTTLTPLLALLLLAACGDDETEVTSTETTVVEEPAGEAENETVVPGSTTVAEAEPEAGLDAGAIEVEPTDQDLTETEVVAGDTAETDIPESEEEAVAEANDAADAGTDTEAENAPNIDPAAAASTEAEADAELAEAQAEIDAAMDDAAEATVTAADQAESDLSAAGEEVEETTEAAAAETGETLAEAGDEAETALDNAVTAAGEGLEEAGEDLAAAGETIEDGAEATVDAVGDAAEATGDAVTDATTTETEVAVVDPAGTTATSMDAETDIAGAYTVGPISAEFDEDGTFVMTQTERSDRRAEGSYTVTADSVTFTDVTGRIGQQSFPMTCDLVSTEDGGFTLAARGDECQIFDGQTFEPAS